MQLLSGSLVYSQRVPDAVFVSGYSKNNNRINGAVVQMEPQESLHFLAYQ